MHKNQQGSQLKILLICRVQLSSVRVKKINICPNRCRSHCSCIYDHTHHVQLSANQSAPWLKCTWLRRREVSLAETEAQPYENSGDAALVTAQRDEHICLLPDDNSGGSSKDSSSSLGPRGVPGHGVDEGSIGDVVDGANDFGSGSKRSIGTAGADADSKVSDGGRHGASSAGASDRGDDDDGWGCWGRFVASWVFPQFVLFLGQVKG